MEKLTVGNVGDILRREDPGFMVVSPVTCLFNECGREAVGVGLVVSELRVDVVVDVPLIQQAKRGRSTTKEYIIILSLTAFCRVAGRPKTKSLTAPKKGAASLDLALKSSEA